MHVPGYGALVLHGVASTALEHTLSILTPSLGPTLTVSITVLGATAFALPFYFFRTVVVRSTPCRIH